MGPLILKCIVLSKLATIFEKFKKMKDLHYSRVWNLNQILSLLLLNKSNYITFTKKRYILLVLWCLFLLNWIPFFVQHSLCKHCCLYLLLEVCYKVGLWFKWLDLVCTKDVLLKIVFRIIKLLCCALKGMLQPITCIDINKHSNRKRKIM